MKSINELLSKPLWQMTGEEFLILNQQSQQNPQEVAPSACEETSLQKKYVYGLGGLARLFGCSLVTANRIKKSGKIDKAISQVGRKIIIDAQLALELAKKGGRRR